MKPFIILEPFATVPSLPRWKKNNSSLNRALHLRGEIQKKAVWYMTAMITLSGITLAWHCLVHSIGFQGEHHEEHQWSRSNNFWIDFFWQGTGDMEIRTEQNLKGFLHCHGNVIEEFLWSISIKRSTVLLLFNSTGLLHCFTQSRISSLMMTEWGCLDCKSRMM